MMYLGMHEQSIIDPLFCRLVFIFMLSSCSQVDVEQLSFRLSYNDLKLFLAIAQSLPSLESKDPKPPDTLKKYEREIKGKLV